MKKQIKQVFNPLSGNFDSIQTSDATKDASQLMLLTADESISDWTNITSDFSISKVDPLFGDASYVLEMNTLSAATHKLIPVDIGFRGTTIALTLNYLMPQGAARVELLDQDNNLIDGATFDIPAANGKEKFGTTVFIPSDVTGIRFKAESRATVAGQVFKFDNVQLSADLLKSVNISNDTDWVSYAPTFGGLGTVSSSSIKWRRDGSDLLIQGTWTNGTVNSSPVTMTLPVGLTPDLARNTIVGTYGTQGTVAGPVTYLTIENELIFGTTNWSVASVGTAHATGGYDSVSIRIPIKGWSASTPSIVAPTDQVTERSIAFRWRSPAQATEANLSATGQIGDYVTGQYASGGNVLSQCTTRPAQTDALMNTEGIYLTSRAYQDTPDPAYPSRYVIKIAEPNQMSACKIVSYKDSAKTILSSLKKYNVGIGVEFGAWMEDFNPTTGLLCIDVGRKALNTVTDHYFENQDGTATLFTYICFTASKLAQGVAIPTRKPYAHITNNSGQSIPNANTINVTGWTIEFDPFGMVDAANGLITILENGVYHITGGFRIDQGGFIGTMTITGSLNNNATNAVLLSGIVSNTYTPSARYSIVTTLFSGEIPLTKGMVLKTFCYQDSGGAKSLVTTPPGESNTQNMLTITKVGDI